MRRVWWCVGLAAGLGCSDSDTDADPNQNRTPNPMQVSVVPSLGKFTGGTGVNIEVRFLDAGEVPGVTSTFVDGTLGLDFADFRPGSLVAVCVSSPEEADPPSTLAYFDEARAVEVPFPSGEELCTTIVEEDAGSSVGLTLLTDLAFHMLLRTVEQERDREAVDQAIVGAFPFLESVYLAPYPVSEQTAAGQIPNNPTGIYAVFLAALAHVAEQVDADQTSAFNLARQFRLDAQDGTVDAQGEGLTGNVNYDPTTFAADIAQACQQYAQDFGAPGLENVSYAGISLVLDLPGSTDIQDIEILDKAFGYVDQDGREVVVVQASTDVENTIDLFLRGFTSLDDWIFSAVGGPNPVNVSTVDRGPGSSVVVPETPGDYQVITLPPGAEFVTLTNAVTAGVTNLPLPPSVQFRSEVFSCLNRTIDDSRYQQWADSVGTPTNNPFASFGEAGIEIYRSLFTAGCRQAQFGFRYAW